MDKFYNFEKYLEKNKLDIFTLSFAEIEDIIGEELCDSAYKYTAYWYPSGHKNLANVVDLCGYKVVNLKLGISVTFERK